MKTENKRKSIKKMNALINDIKNYDNNFNLKNSIYSNKNNFSNYNFRNNLNNTLAVNCQIKSLKPKIHRKGEDRVLQKNISHKNPVILAHQKIEDDLKNMKE
jgi:hypothetical protein